MLADYTASIRGCTLGDSKRIIGLRNQIIHGYDSVSDENIWGIITIHLPKLKTGIDILTK
jgi:uncharacterized protein with HEPN domain